MNPLDASLWVKSRAVCLLIAVAIGLLAAARPLAAAEQTMFDGDRAQRALEAIAARAGHKPRLLSLDITGEALGATVQDRDQPDRVVTWRVSRPLGFKSVLGDGAVRGRSSEPSLYSGSLEENLFDLDPAALARLPGMADAALARARLQEPGAVVRMELQREVQILPKRGIAAPQWTVRVGGRRERADIFADLSGKIIATNLRGTLRYQRLDLRAGGANLDELVQQIRDELKNHWAVRYVEVETKSISFEASLANAPAAPQVTRFTADIDGVRTANLDMPRLGRSGAEASHPFGLTDVDWQRLPEMQKRALESTGIADAKIDSVVLLKPKREFGDSMQWTRIMPVAR